MSGLLTLSVLCVVSLLHIVAATPPRLSLDNFETHHVIHPLNLLSPGRVTRMMGHTDVHGHPIHIEAAQFEFQAFSQKFVLNLEINRDLLSPNFEATYGDKVIQRGAEHCYYGGTVNNDPQSLVVISTCDDALEGFFFYGTEKYVVEPAVHHRLEAHSMKAQSGSIDAHVVYRMSGMKAELRATRDGKWCASQDSHDHSVSHHPEEFLHELEEIVVGGHHRKLLQTTVAKYVELHLVNDHPQVTARLSAAAATARAISIANGINKLYAKLPLPLKVVITLTGVTNLDVTTQFQVSGVAPNSATDIGLYLNAFTSWYSPRRASFKSDDAQLITGLAISGGTAGIAWVGTMCGTQSTGVNEDSSGSFVWTVETTTHEMGHNFGCSHDSNGNACNPSGSVMAAIGRVDRVNPESVLDWSTCSNLYIQNKVQSLANTPSDCLANQPSTIFGTTAICGDYIVSTGEQCDKALAPGICGDNCQFKPGVQCTFGDCCDISTGLYKPAGFSCRLSMHQCDLTDQCDGVSATCPTDYYYPDGSSCTEAGAGGLCYSGSCLGRDGQCSEAFRQYLGVTGYVSCNGNCGNLTCKLNNGPCLRITLTGSTVVQVKDRTPCTGCPSGPCYCDSEECVAAPALTSCSPACQNGGSCANGGVCLCAPGWTGSACEIQKTCDVECGKIHRETCNPTYNTACGACLSGFRERDIETVANNIPCWLNLPDLSFSVVSTGDAETKSNGSMAFDGDYYSHWRGIVNATAGNVARLTITYTGSFILKQYEIMSPNTEPASDVKAFVMLGSTSPDGPWSVVDQRTDVAFTERHQWRTFRTAFPRSYSVYRLEITDTSGGPASGKFSQIAELRLYEDKIDTEQNGYELSLGVSAGMAVFTVVAALVALVLMKRRKGTHGSSNQKQQKSVLAPAVPPRVQSQVSSSTISLMNGDSSSVLSPSHKFASPSAASTGSTGTGTGSGAVSPSTYKRYAGNAFVVTPTLPTPAGTARLPLGWVSYTTEEGVPYYYNDSTGESRWERP